MFNFTNIYCFIPVSGCGGMGFSALLCPGAYNSVKTTLAPVIDETVVGSRQVVTSAVANQPNPSLTQTPSLTTSGF
jgi:hypothetical protein